MHRLHSAIHFVLQGRIYSTGWEINESERCIERKNLACIEYFQRVSNSAFLKVIITNVLRLFAYLSLSACKTQIPFTQGKGAHLWLNDLNVYFSALSISIGKSLFLHTQVVRRQWIARQERDVLWARCSKTRPPLNWPMQVAHIHHVIYNFIPLRIEADQGHLSYLSEVLECSRNLTSKNLFINQVSQELFPRFMHWSVV